MWNGELGKWKMLKGARKKGISAVGTAAYAEHPTTDILTFSYRLPPLMITRRWRPGQPPPQDLFNHFAAGGLMEAHNSFFELCIWLHVGCRRYGWPPIAIESLRCSMATARVNCLPGALGDLSDVLRLPTPKDKRGKDALDRLSVPRDPTKKDARLWITPDDDPETFTILCDYCDTDLDAEHGVAERCVPMSAAELEFWLEDQRINYRGIGIDVDSVMNCMAVLEQAFDRYGDEYRQITGLNPTQLEATKGWLAAKGVHLAAMDEEAVDDALSGPQIAPHPPGGVNPVRRVLEIRQLIGSASVKKIYAIANAVSYDGRLRNTMIHHGARTGRPTGDLAQPLNMPKAGPDLKWCGCGKPMALTHTLCPWCLSPGPFNAKCEWPAAPEKWPDKSPYVIAPGYDIGPDFVLEVMRYRSLDLVEYYFGDAVLAIAGSVRSLFVAGPGKDLICSDYSAIEAVVLACMAGEQWRIDAFVENKPMYLVGAAKITGKTQEFYEDYKAQHGAHHEDRQKIGKVSELACGYGGWIGSFKAFGSEESDEWIREKIVGWRDASPMIVEFWGGQFRGKPWDDNAPHELYGMEGHFILAASNPGHVFEFRGMQFYTRDYSDIGRAVIIRLPSGRELTYHDVRLVQSKRKWAKPGEWVIVYKTWNSNPKYGAPGWVDMDTYGGKLTENVIQAISHDILRFAILNLRAAGYPTVLHIYDEILAEIPQGFGSIEEFERIMQILPPWCAGWPIRAAGGWRGYRYRKG